MTPDRGTRFHHNFDLDRFQLEAFAAIDGGRSVLVAAPTGSGKTVVAEHAIDVALRRGGKVFYTTPIKALSNQKFADLSRVLGADQVGLLTGDNAIRGDAPVVVMTTEVLRNMIYAGSPTLRGLEFVVLDEVHYLQDAYRGPVWEEVIIHAPPEVRLVCLSATISNAADLAAWITTVRGPTDVVTEWRRPVELHNHYLLADRLAESLQQLPTIVDGRPNPHGTQYDSDTLRGPRGMKGRPRRRYSTPRRLDVVEHLEERELLPAIYFVFSRNGCDEAARSVVDAGVRLTSAPERQQIRAIAEQRTSHLADHDLDVLGYDHWLHGLEQGVAAHHAGMVPAFKEAVEACFVQGLVKVVFATETLALGINMPARSVVIETLTKFTGETHEFLTPAEYTQLTGRAGRRGIDTVGHALVLWSPFVGFDQVAALASSREFELRSAFRPTYNMAANLVRRYDRAEAHRLVNLSFAQFQSDDSVVQLESRRADRQRLLARSEQEAHCDRGDVEAYRALLRTDATSRGADPDQRAAPAHITDALARLKPGELLRAAAPHGRLAVLSVGVRRGGTVRLRAVTTQGRVRNLTADDFDATPDVIGAITLPMPYRPNSASFCREVADRLRRAQVRSGRRGSGPRPYGGKGRGAHHRRKVSGDGTTADDHPVARCPDRRRHVRAAERAERLRRELTDLDRRIGGRQHSLSARFDQVLEIMQARGFASGWALTDRGKLLTRVYHESDLLVSEVLSAGYLDGLDADDLAGLASCLTYEHRSRVPPGAPRFPSENVRRRFSAIEDAARALVADERERDLPATREPDPTLVGAARAWAKGAPLERLLEHDGLSPGDFVRNMKQLIDLLRQVAELAPDPSTRDAATEAVHRLFRGVVAAAAALPSTVPTHDAALAGFGGTDPRDGTDRGALPPGEPGPGPA